MFEATVSGGAEAPLVSIVTPTFNQAAFLPATIESVLSQDYPRVEYIVLDDGSTDNTKAILESYASKIRWQSHPNAGQSATLNRGWRLATGGLIGYLSSDDLLVPGAISELVRALQKCPRAVVAYCDFKLIDSFGREIREVATEDYDVDRLQVDLVCQPGPGALFRREIFENTGGWAEELRQVPDFEFWLRASKLGDFVRVPKVLAGYRIHEGSISFRPVSHQRSMEIVSVVSGFWPRYSVRKSKALASAYQLAAKSHLQSGRFLTGIQCATKAVRCNVGLSVSIRFWRSLASGAFRRWVFKLRRAWAPSASCGER